MTDNARSWECVCKQNKGEGTPKCTECTRRVHWTCTELPVYQLCFFTTCRCCTKAFMDDSATEEIELVKTVRQTTEDRQSQDTARNNESVYSQLHANHQTTTTLLQNLQTAITNLTGQVHRVQEIRGDGHYNLTGQVHRVQEIRGDAITHLADTHSAGHQDRQPAATVDRSTQTTPTQTAHPTVTTDRSTQTTPMQTAHPTVTTDRSTQTTSRLTGLNR